LIIFWGIIEIYRINLGFTANIDEFFPSLISFDLITLVFSIPPQIMMVLGPHVLPVDISTVIIYLIFIILEIIVSLVAMKKIVSRKTALYYLRNTTTLVTKSQKNKVKSSDEIAQEVEEYYKKNKNLDNQLNYNENKEKKYLFGSNPVILNKLKSKQNEIDENKKYK
jgi:hypothetical protein